MPAPDVSIAFPSLEEADAAVVLKDFGENSVSVVNIDTCGIFLKEILMPLCYKPQCFENKNKHITHALSLLFLELFAIREDKESQKWR